VNMTTICADLKDELEALDAMVSPLDEAAWDHPTPAEGWTVRDQIIHIGGTVQARQPWLLPSLNGSRGNFCTPTGANASIASRVKPHHWMLQVC